MTVSIIVGTFGNLEWPVMAANYALPSAWGQRPAAHEVIHVHGRSLCEARNAGAKAATGEWLVFLDADDSLNPRYCHAIVNGQGDLRQPATSFDGGPASCIPAIDLRGGNFLVIGTAVRKILFDKVGGFYDEPAFEDYSLWLRCVKQGAEVSQTPDAIYSVTTTRPHSRSSHPRKWEVMKDIVARYG